MSIWQVNPRRRFDNVSPRQDSPVRLCECRWNEDAFVEAFLTWAKAFQIVEGREALLGIIEGEKLTVYRVPIRGAFLRLGLRTVLGVYVSQIVCSARGSHVSFRDDECREAKGEFVEPAPNGRVLRPDQAPTETFVVALALFEGSVDEEIKPCRFRRRTVS